VALARCKSEFRVGIPEPAAKDLRNGINASEISCGLGARIRGQNSFCFQIICSQLDEISARFFDAIRPAI
jgi:hypothetical protein